MKCSKKLHNLVWMLFAYLSLSGLNHAYASTTAELVAEGFDLPWSLTFLDKETILISERAGAIKTLNLHTKQTKSIDGVWELAFGGQGGLLDIARHPEYPKKPWLYATYSKPQKGGASTALARFQVKDQSITQFESLFVSNAVTSGGRHFGSRIAFDDQGYLFFTSGDRGERDWAQDLSNHAGTVIRLNDDGSVPPDNPFVEDASAQAEIWSYGHRNPQGLAFDSARQRLWLIEHGPRGGDEINVIKRGANYGWPVISYGKEYWGPISVGEGTEKQGMEQPIKYYVPSIAPSSLLLHQGDLYAGALKLRHINHVRLNDAGQVISEARLFEDLEQRIRDLTTGPDGLIYFITDQGKLYRF